MAELRGRAVQRDVLDRLAEAVQAGQSRALVVRGDPGVGKTALLDYLAERAPGAGCRVARVAGVRSETELAFAGLHQLCTPMLDGDGQLPVPQRDALRTAFGLAPGPPPDRLLVGLAVLTVLSGMARDRPLICVVDDEQWLDQGSAQAFGFAARRLAAGTLTTGPVGLVFATREPDEALTGLPELVVAGLRDDHARELLESALAGPLDAQVRDLIIAETRGNPLALLELARGLAPAELAGGFGLPGAAPLADRIEDSCRREMDALPDPTRRLLLLAATDPSGDRALVWRAAGLLGIPVQAGTPAVEAGMVEFDGRVRFRHPLARSAVYRSASLPDRQQMHAALAEATDLRTGPDRRAWHRAQAAAGPDDDVAAELECSAGQAQVRGGLAAAAAFLARSVALTADPTRHAERILAAAQANLQAGVFGKALELLATAETGPLDDFAGARVDLLRGQILFASGPDSEAPALLLKAASRLAPLDVGLARETYLRAWMAALSAGRLAGTGDLLEVCRAAQGLPPSAEPVRTVDLVLDSLAMIVTDGPAAAGPTLRRAVSAFVNADITPEEALRWGWAAQAAVSALWDDDAWRAVLARQVRLARDAGALDQLPVMLSALGTASAWSGDFATAEALSSEANAICAATGRHPAPFTALLLAALRGRHAEAVQLVKAAIAEAEAGAQGIATACAHWTASILCNGLGRYQEALTAARQASEDTTAVHISMWALPELVEAGTRSGNERLAAGAAERLAEFTQAGGTDFGLGIQARSRALVAGSRTAEGLYLEAIERLGGTQLRPELARAYLLYGEWLRRENRRVDAREQLRTAHDMLAAIGMEAFAERARKELQATGENVRKRTAGTRYDLTAQERQIARLARDGLSNPEIGTKLFLSARTVEWHLRNVFTKLGIRSRRELAHVLDGPGHRLILEGIP